MRTKISGLVSGAAVSQLESLYRRRYEYFVRVATAFLRDEERAVDVVHDAFAIAIANRRTYRGEGPLEAWVWRIVVNGARKALGDSRQAEPIELSTSDERADRQRVRDAILELPERQRLTLFLRYYADLDYRSIATALEVSPGTVGATLNAAHASMRRTLEEVRS
jgi:RNA polymerase sigma-70 factor, ECF subfamily